VDLFTFRRGWVDEVIRAHISCQKSSRSVKIQQNELKLGLKALKMSLMVKAFFDYAFFQPKNLF
jgi:hypothetical protein